MSKNYVIGFPRIGEKRELKFALESYWAKKSDFSEVRKVARELKKRHWNYQKDAGIDYISSNDFSYYDNMLDTSVMIGAIPKRFRDIEDKTQRYFSMARGDDSRVAMSMTKWLNTNYHYIVPELSLEDKFSLDLTKIKEEYQEAKELGILTKINLIGPITYLALSRRVDGGDCFELFDRVLPIYKEALIEIAKLNSDILVQFDEPIFAKDVTSLELSLLKRAYDVLAGVDGIRVAVVTYFDSSNEATKVLLNTPVYAIGLDLVYGEIDEDVKIVLANSNKVLIAGVIDSRNVWICDIDKKVEFLKNLNLHCDNIIISTSCSLLHTPFTLKYEDNLQSEIKSWLSFATEKLDELTLLSAIYFDGKESLDEKQKETLAQNQRAIKLRESSKLINNLDVQKRVSSLTDGDIDRKSPFEVRIKKQKELLNLPILPTTTIGSFPQTTKLRSARKAYKSGEIDYKTYEDEMKRYIDDCIAFQEECNLDVLVHGEPERNDMVEYFGEMLDGFAFSQNGWVQSYGSRCVKPPLIYGDVSRPKAMSVEWIKYAQSKTKKVMKGMLTGPVTILNWSFVRDDRPRNQTATQIALAIADEISDLQDEGVKIIQVDEAAFKEGYPLKKADASIYEKWAIESFRISTAVAFDETQIHTHMCYSDFNDIIHTIQAMDADVISIETARSGNRLLKIFKESGYKMEVGPGVYDIHSPRIPSVKEIEDQIALLLEVLPKEQLWINPDCGLKTRKWQEVKPSLLNMTQAVKKFR
jgi:5-methyltetrahydropteroyltriglutamate--homocysteine methyltransferase